jgi:hypothetical protein
MHRLAVFVFLQLDTSCSVLLRWSIKERQFFIIQQQPNGTHGVIGK